MSLAENERKIVVAMSGGVDSAASALLLRDAGHPLVGIAMQVWDYRQNGGSSSRATCCAPADFEDARKVADFAEFPFYVFDFEESFRKAVISPFVDSYVNGFTPNPCLDCNRKVKFKMLRERAKSLGIDTIATGHYARIKELPSGELGLFTALDLNKDQTYFLYAMTQHDLRHTLFPVGEMTKPEVRKYLEKSGLKIASKPESQDICFVSDSAAKFVENNASDLARKGKIVNSQGEAVAEHSGIHNFTIGQRKGLGLTSANPLYVLNIDADSQKVTVGEKSELESEEFYIKDVSFVSSLEESEFEAVVKLRYRHSGTRCRIKKLSEGVYHAIFLEEWAVVSPGQAAVFYSEVDEKGCRQVFGGGIIYKSLD